MRWKEFKRKTKCISNKVSLQNTKLRTNKNIQQPVMVLTLKCSWMLSMSSLTTDSTCPFRVCSSQSLQMVTTLEMSASGIMFTILIIWAGNQTPPIFFLNAVRQLLIFGGTQDHASVRKQPQLYVIKTTTTSNKSSSVRRQSLHYCLAVYDTDALKHFKISNRSNLPIIS